MKNISLKDRIDAPSRLREVVARYPGELEDVNVTNLVFM